jgi:hypothetical protein
MSARTPTPEERRWVEQWRVAGPELARIKRQELRAMTDEHALRAAIDLLDLADLAPIDQRRWTGSGLVDQQAVLRRRRR